MLLKGVTVCIETTSEQSSAPRDAGGLSRAKSLYSDTRGAVLVEYAVLVGAVAIAGSIALVTVGLALVHSFDFVRGVLLCPIP
jgi:Flp pilus assembly pilin Flp